MLVQNRYIVFIVQLYKENEVGQRVAVCNSLTELEKEVKSLQQQLEDGEYLGIVSVELAKEMDDAFGCAKGSVYLHKGEEYTSLTRQIILNMNIKDQTIPINRSPHSVIITAKQHRDFDDQCFVLENGFVKRVSVKDYHMKYADRKCLKKKELEGYVCPKCLNSVLNCGCEEWSDSFVEMDKGMQPIIKVLNDKGYRTVYCCEGHSWKEPFAYIMFDMQYPFEVPDGWFTTGDYCIRCDYRLVCEGNETFDKTKQRIISRLLEWVSHIPEWK